jgi:squalene synthase HpnC
VSVNHYENFPVASLLLPKRLRRAVKVIYAFARSADDIADEGDATVAARLGALAHYSDSLDAIERGIKPSEPIFESLALEINHHGIPLQPFRDLLSAFSQDVNKKRYTNLPEVIDYCQRSANPVGRLMLHLYGEHDPQYGVYSDAICTGLQLTNFLQDIAIDYDKNRIYLPQDELAAYHISEAQIARGDSGGLWQTFMLKQIERAHRLLQSGAPLGRHLKGRIGLELRMTILGGETILRKLHVDPGCVFHHRPVLTQRDWIVMLVRGLFGRI